MKEKVFTNCFLVEIDDNSKPIRVCLAMKKRGLGEGMWNGSGGKPDEGEKVEKAAVREVSEELMVQVLSLEKWAEVHFVLREEELTVQMHAFLVTVWEGEPKETEEMRPEWFDVEAVPYEKMWKSDREWLSTVLSGKRIRAKYTYAREGGEVETRKIEEVETL